MRTVSEKWSTWSAAGVSELGGPIEGAVGEVLLIRNISRYCDGYYLCEASNEALPKVTRSMKVTVQCESASRPATRHRARRNNRDFF